MAGHSTHFRGEAGRRRAEQELEKQKAAAEARKSGMGMPYRFRLAPGDTRQIVVVDDAPDFFAFEHNLKNPKTGFWDIFTGCIAEFDNCPVCEASGKEAYYAMYLTVIDLTPYTSKNGDEVEFSRKLMVVKPAQQKKFTRFFEKNGTLRGAIFDMTRDGDKDSAIGNDIEFVEFMPEDELATYVREWADKEKKRHVEDCAVPYDYEKLFPEPNMASLRAIVGGRPAPGSKEQEERELGGGSRRASGRKPAAREEASDDDWDDADQAEKPWKDTEHDVSDDSTPARTRGRTASAPTRGRPAPAPRVTGRRLPAVAEEEEEDNAPVARPSRTATRRTPR